MFNMKTMGVSAPSSGDLWGVRLDYLAKNTPTQSLSFGGTIERLNERPFFTKTNYNEDPIRNYMYGADVNYRTQVPEITRLLNKMPL